MAVVPVTTRALAGDPAWASITLAWDPVPGSDVVGYNLYYGISSGVYTNVLATTNTQATVTGLTGGVRYYFAVTTANAGGLESLFSVEVSSVVGSASPPVQLVISQMKTGQLKLAAAAPAGYQYEVLASSNLLTWTSLAIVSTDSSGSILFTDPEAPTNTCRLYQLRQVSP